MALTFNGDWILQRQWSAERKEEKEKRKENQENKKHWTIICRWWKWNSREFQIEKILKEQFTTDSFDFWEYMIVHNWVHVSIFLNTGKMTLPLRVILYETGFSSFPSIWNLVNIMKYYRGWPESSGCFFSWVFLKFDSFSLGQ